MNLVVGLAKLVSKYMFYVYIAWSIVADVILVGGLVWYFFYR